MEERKEYVIARTPDKMRLANLINMAKGPNRTMAQFAELCNVSASTLSRAVNGKITKPLAQELIYALVENAAEDISIDSFMRANGMLEKEMVERRAMRGHDPYERRQRDLDREIMVKNTISSELLNRGKLIRFFFRLPDRENVQSKFAFSHMSSFAVWLEDERLMWNFIVIPTILSEVEDRDRRFLKTHTMDRLTRLFLADAWEPEFFAGMCTSIAFLDKEFFDEQVAMLGQAQVNTDISLILIDTEKEEVLEEFAIPKKNGECIESIFATPVINKEADDSWPDGFNYDDDFEE